MEERVERASMAERVDRASIVGKSFFCTNDSHNEPKLQTQSRIQFWHRNPRDPATLTLIVKEPQITHGPPVETRDLG